MKETYAKRAAAEARLIKPLGRRRMTRDEITSLVQAVGDLIQVIKDTDPAGDPRRDRPEHDPVPHRGHLVSWAKLSPRTIQSGARSRSGKTGKGNPYLKGALGEAAAAAARTDTFLGERYRRPVRRSGKLKALVAIARSILVIVWHLLADPAPAVTTSAPATTSAAPTRTRKHVTTSRQLEASASPSPSPRQPDPHSPARPYR